jgi:hypothetical protein
MVRLTLGRMLEATVGNCSHELVLQKKVAESGRVHADVAAFLVGSVASSEASLGRCPAAVGGHLGGDLLIGVVDEIFFVRHGESCM